MLFHALAHRSKLNRFAADNIVFREGGHVGRRKRRAHAEELLQYPFAARNRRSPVGDRGHRQHASLAQQTEPVLIRQRYTPEAVSLDIGNPIVLRQTLVDEGIVCGQQIDHAAIFADDAVEEQFRLTAHGLQKIIVGIRIKVDVGIGIRQATEVQPLRCEILCQRLRTRVGQEALYLSLEDGGVAEFPLICYRDQFFVRKAAPEEVRQPGGEFQIAHPVVVARTDTGEEFARNGRQIRDSPGYTAKPSGCPTRSSRVRGPPSRPA